METYFLNQARLSPNVFDDVQPLRLAASELVFLLPRGEELLYIISKGIPMSGQMLMMSSAGVIMFGLVNREGLNASAAYGASLQLWNYLQMPASMR